MKKWTAVLCCITLVVSQFSGMTVGAYADADEISVEEKAKVLSEIDILAGDGNSFNLDQPLRRCDAAAFLVKAMGVNIVVLQNKATYSKTKFKDVPSAAWYAPYVGYMTQIGIITGNSDGSFTPNDYISEKAFLTMLLKSMGYTTEDFTWNTVNQFAYEIGLVTDIGYVFKDDDNLNYKRQDVVNALYNALNKKMKGKDKKFAQLLVDGKIISNDKAEKYGFVLKDKLSSEIKEVKVNSYTQVTVTFNEAVEVPSLDQIQIYEKNNPTVKLTPKQIQGSGNTLTIDMSTQNDKTQYVLEFTKLTDVLGNKAAFVKKEFIGYTVVEVVSSYFKISKVEPINKKAINIYFSHPVNTGSELELLYDIYLGETKFVEGNYKTISVKRSDSNTNMVTLSLKEAVFESGREYAVKVKGDLESTYGVNLNKGDGETMAFTGSTAVATAVTLTQAYCQEGKYVYFTFSQPVDRESAMKIANYSVREVETNNYMAVSQVYGMKGKEYLNKYFVLKIGEVNIGKNYELIVNNIYDTNKNFNMGELKVTFSGSYLNNQILLLSNVAPIDMTTIVATFNRELNASSLNANVTVDSLSVAMKELDPDDPSKMIIYLNAATPLQIGRTYGVVFYSGITDYIDKSPLYNLAGAVTGNGVVKSGVGVESATFIGDSTIMIKYNKAISKTLSAQISQYDIYYNDGKTEKLLIPGTVEMVSDRSVVLKLPYLLPTGTFRIQIRNIYDVSNQYKTPLLNVEVK